MRKSSVNGEPSDSRPKAGEAVGKAPPTGPTVKAEDFGKSFAVCIAQFAEHVEALRTTWPLLGTMMLSIRKASGDKLRAFLDSDAVKVVDDGAEKKTFELDAVASLRFNRLNRDNIRAHSTQSLLPRALIVLLVCQYDAYLGRLLRLLFLSRPEILNASEKTLGLSEILGFPSIEDLRNHVLRKEIETFLRKSHVAQFEWLERTFKLKLRDELPVWPVFVEVTERRNLFAHADGVVSPQYLAACAAAGHKFSATPAAGQALHATKQYAQDAAAAVFEVGVKLGHVMWRKLRPEDRADADLTLNRLAYELIHAEDFGLAVRVLEFACDVLKKHSSEANRLALSVNLAQAYKWSGMLDKCKARLDAIDFSALGLDFQLAEAVLRDDLERVIELVALIGPSGPVKKTDYKDWPLFRKLRGESRFRDAYEDVFGEGLSIHESDGRPGGGEGAPVLGGQDE